MNLFDMISGGGNFDPIDPTSLPFEPLCESSSIGEICRSFAVAERAISFTGEDFDVFEDSRAFARVRGAMLHLPGKDRMRIISCSTNQEIVVLDKKLAALTPTYDIYEGISGMKIGWIEKDVIALTDTFSVYAESAGGFGPLKAPPVYRISGDFIDRKFEVKNDEGKLVARVRKNGLFQFDSFNHYQVQVAPGMDAMLVIACTCAIDEEFDEEHKKREKKDEEQRGSRGGWF
eukprot:CAMPEP_0196824360 /NCGR_PEP_ID=MMETSP1362-20130617/91548_1 /TAXON_ID=163516 /ORGANISM="Leptocylindrus danicus, Strain CCMP1856" /LENGTH=231 /DNA_ID=CAMNT_0042204597 /DNA_START=160 /DNA_END=855 /DNA_ORIENTATION=+